MRLILALQVLGRACDSPADGLVTTLSGVLLDDIRRSEVGSKSGQTLYNETKHNNPSDCVREHQPTADVVGWVDVAKANRKNGDFAKVQCVRVRPGEAPAAEVSFDGLEYHAARRKPKEEHHGLKDKSPVRVGEGKVLRIVP